MRLLLFIKVTPITSMDNNELMSTYYANVYVINIELSKMRYVWLGWPRGRVNEVGTAVPTTLPLMKSLNPSVRTFCLIEVVVSLCVWNDNTHIYERIRQASRYVRMDLGVKDLKILVNSKECILQFSCLKIASGNVWFFYEINKVKL